MKLTSTDADQQRVAQRDQVGRPLGRLDAGDPGHGQHVALGDRAPGDQRRGLGLHEHLAAGDGPPVGRLLGGDVDHAGTAQRVEVGELEGRHGVQVYGLTGPVAGVERPFCPAHRLRAGCATDPGRASKEVSSGTIRYRETTGCTGGRSVLFLEQPRRR